MGFGGFGRLRVHKEPVQEPLKGIIKVLLKEGHHQHRAVPESLTSEARPTVRSLTLRIGFPLRAPLESLEGALKGSLKGSLKGYSKGSTRVEPKGLSDSN